MWKREGEPSSGPDFEPLPSSPRDNNEHRRSENDREEKTQGVKNIEAIQKAWTKKSIIIAWCSIELLCVAMALVNQTITIYTNYATASFEQQSLLSTIQVVNGVLNVVVRPPMAKIADVIGRFEGFLISIVSWTIGFIMLAAAPNIETYFVAQIFYTIGQMGLEFMVQVFATDTTDMVNRAIFIILPNLSFLFVPWVGGPLTSAVLEHSTWRWGIAMWAIIVPVCSAPLLAILLYMKFKVRRIRGHQKLHWRHVVHQMDLGGCAILATGLAFFFIALPLAADSSHSAWKAARTIFMVIIGGLCIVGFPFYEQLIPKYPIMSFRVFKKLDVTKSFLFIMFYYLAFYIYYPYFFSWLIVVFNLSNTAATNVSVVSTVASTASGTLGAFAVKYTRKVKWFIVVGSGIALLGVGLIYRFRQPGSTTAQMVVAQLIDGVGSGLLVTPNQVLVQSYCSHAEVAQTTALYLSFLALGQVIGDSISGSLYRRQYPQYLAEYAPDLNSTQINMVTNDMTYAVTFPMGSTIREGINRAFNEVMRTMLIPPLVFFGVMFLIAVTFRNVNLDKVNQATKGAVVIGNQQNGSQSDTDSDSDESDDSYSDSDGDWNDSLLR